MNITPGRGFQAMAKKTELMAQDAISETLRDIDRIADVTNDYVSRAIMQARTQTRTEPYSGFDLGGKYLFVGL